MGDVTTMQVRRTKPRLVSTIAFRETTLPDLVSVTARARDIDRWEMLAQSPRNDVYEVAALTYTIDSMRMTTTYNGTPVAVAGVQKLHPKLGVGWMWATEDLRRVIKAHTRYWSAVLDELFRVGVYHRIEVRSLAEHRQSHAWLERFLGFTPVSVLRRYGKGGEDFILFERVKY